ncbi:MAG: hypothetical protein RBS17_11930 [Coriobacteriia bacterium]|nr:hypothetical protein [Coriobacteriia bacterium]
MAPIDEPHAFDDDLTTEHAHGMLDFYAKTLIELGYRSGRYEDIEGHIGACRFETPKYDTLNHALWMCDQSRIFLRGGRLAKAYRWIGTIQGILFMNGVFSIVELKEHNRLELPAVKPRGQR